MVAGKVESGCIQNGDRVMLMPAGEGGIMKGMLSTCLSLEATKPLFFIDGHLKFLRFLMELLFPQHDPMEKLQKHNP